MVDPEKYFIPASSKWPIIAAVGLFILAIGAATCFHRDPYGPYILSVGIFVLIYMKLLLEPFFCNWTFYFNIINIFNITFIL